MTITSSGNAWPTDAASDDPPVPVQSASQARIAAEEDPRWQCGIAATRRQRESAFRLIYQAYTRSGLGVPNRYEMRVTPYHLLPTTTIFTASTTQGIDAGEAFSTVTLVGDGELGLPLERTYPEEVADRRQQGLRLAEVSCLADRRQDFRRFLPVFIALNRWMIQFAQAQQIDEILVAVHPKHARFYTRYFGFEIIGGLTSYPTANNRPAVALSFDFHRDHRTCPYFDHFFADPLPREQLHPAPLLSEDVTYFGQMIDPAFGAAPSPAIACM